MQSTTQIQKEPILTQDKESIEVKRQRGQIDYRFESYCRECEQKKKKGKKCPDCGQNMRNKPHKNKKDRVVFRH